MPRRTLDRAMLSTVTCAVLLSMAPANAGVWMERMIGTIGSMQPVSRAVVTDDILGPWPPEIVGHASCFPRDCGHYEDDVWANRGGSDGSSFLLPGRSLAPAHQPDKLLSQTTYRCPTCGQHAWATPTAQLLCGICKRPMQAYL